MPRKTAILVLILAIISLTAPAYSLKPILKNQQNFSKQSFQLNQIIPRATKQEYGNVTVYSTVGQVNQNTITRWSVIPDLWAYIFVNRQKWPWVANIPRNFIVILVSEMEFKQLWPWVKDTAGGLYNHPNEVWLKEIFNFQDSPVIHEVLHKVLTWIYFPNGELFSETRLPGYSPLIVRGGEILADHLSRELNFNPNPAIFNPNRFNAMWNMAKNLMRGQGFIGVENVPIPRILNCRPGQNCAWQIEDVNIYEYEAWQRYNSTGEIYLGIITLTKILHYYNDHQENIGLFDLAVCNAKKLFNQYLGGNPGEFLGIFFQGQFINCE